MFEIIGSTGWVYGSEYGVNPVFMHRCDAETLLGNLICMAKTGHTPSVRDMFDWLGLEESTKAVGISHSYDPRLRYMRFLVTYGNDNTPRIGDIAHTPTNGYAIKFYDVPKLVSEPFKASYGNVDLGKKYEMNSIYGRAALQAAGKPKCMPVNPIGAGDFDRGPIAEYIKNDVKSAQEAFNRYREQNMTHWMPRPKKVIYANPKTIVLWDDGTKTIVSCAEGDTYSEYAGFCAALAQKLYKKTYRVHKMLDKVSVRQSPKKKKNEEDTNEET